MVRSRVGILARALNGVWLALFLVLCFQAAMVAADEKSEATPAKKKDKFKDFKKLVEDATVYDGLFTLHHKDDHLYAEIKNSQLKKMYLAPMAIARGMASAGTPLNFGDEWILMFRRAGDNIQVVRKNIRYEAPKDTPLAKAVEQNYTDSILLSLPILAKNSAKQSVVVDFSDIFLNNFARLPLGNADRSRTRWHKVKAFPNNVELQVETTFRGRPSYGFDDGVIDQRGITVVVHYSLSKRPEPGYKPRLADPRVGHFLNATKDFGSKDPNSVFVRRINRWRLQKANPGAELSPPKKQLVWWVENTVPHEYRPYVEEGILEWNKAFRKIGFRNAIGVRWQNDDDEFDPEDINYCTFRWITTPNTFAMSGLRADPITGEMIDGDVIFDASWIRAWKSEYALLVGAPAPTGMGDESAPQIQGVGEIISPMFALKQGYGLPHSATRFMRAAGVDHQLQGLVPEGQSLLQRRLNERFAPAKFASCQCASAKRHEYALAAMSLAARAGGNDVGGNDVGGNSSGRDGGDERGNGKAEGRGIRISRGVYWSSD